MKRLEAITYIVIRVIIFLVVSTMDYQDEVMEQKHYCEMVEQGHWPDYEEKYDEVCNTDSTEETTSEKGQE